MKEILQRLYGESTYVCVPETFVLHAVQTTAQCRAR